MPGVTTTHPGILGWGSPGILGWGSPQECLLRVVGGVWRNVTNTSAQPRREGHCSPRCSWAFAAAASVNFETSTPRFLASLSTFFAAASIAFPPSSRPFLSTASLALSITPLFFSAPQTLLTVLPSELKKPPPENRLSSTQNEMS